VFLLPFCRWVKCFFFFKFFVTVKMINYFLFLQRFGTRSRR
jgi:hypothetical protein